MRRRESERLAAAAAAALIVEHQHDGAPGGVSSTQTIVPLHLLCVWSQSSALLCTERRGYVEWRVMCQHEHRAHFQRTGFAIVFLRECVPT